MQARVGPVAVPRVASPAPPSDWRSAIPLDGRSALRAWFLAIAAMTFAVLVVGGITRLTLSGLSIVSWRPFTGVIPPVTDAHWRDLFAQYQQFPEYQGWRSGMTLREFKFIFFWEYLHRLLARGIGLVILAPLLLGWRRGWLTRPLLRRLLGLIVLVALQGAMGWYMVASGLVDRPSVSHYRLAGHLSLALVLFGSALWMALEIAPGEPAVMLRSERRLLTRGLALLGGVLGLQVIWGAFTAGLRAGKYYPTFPGMGGRLVPTNLLYLDPPLSNFVANPVAVQWTHRVIGTVLTIVVIGFAVAVRSKVRDPGSRRLAFTLLLGIGLQYLLGIATLLRQVPVNLGVAHQATAVLLIALWLSWAHRVTRARAFD